MDPAQIQQVVDQLHLEKKVPREKVFQIIEEAMIVAAKRHAGQEADIAVHIDRETCGITIFRDNVPLSSAEITERIGAQTARQIFTQKIREAENDIMYQRYQDETEQLVSGTVLRFERGSIIVKLPDGFEAFIPRSEQVPGEKFKPEQEPGKSRFENAPGKSFKGVGDRITALVIEVTRQKNNSKIRVVLSRTRPLFLQRVLEREIPEISEGIITIEELSRDPGHRAKVAVSSIDPRLDVVGACLGVNGARVRAVRAELPSNEQIDFVPWVDDDAEFIKRALKPAEISEVILCALLGRAIVLVTKEERSKAIGRKGQNVRLATRLCGWDIEIMTQEELQAVLDGAVEKFKTLPGLTGDAADAIVAAGFTSYDDIAVIEPADLMEIGKLTEEEVTAVIAEAERRAEHDTAIQAAADAADAAEKAVAAGEEAACCIAADFQKAEHLVRDVRDAAADAKRNADEAAKSADIVDSPEVKEAAKNAAEAAERAGRAAENARMLIESARAKQNQEKDRGREQRPPRGSR